MNLKTGARDNISMFQKGTEVALPYFCHGRFLFDIEFIKKFCKKYKIIQLPPILNIPIDKFLEEYSGFKHDPNGNAVLVATPLPYYFSFKINIRTNSPVYETPEFSEIDTKKLDPIRFVRECWYRNVGFLVKSGFDSYIDLFWVNNVLDEKFLRGEITKQIFKEGGKYYTRESRYSTTPEDQCIMIGEILEAELRNFREENVNLTVLDANANVGGNTCGFIRSLGLSKYKIYKTTAIELDEYNYLALEKNTDNCLKGTGHNLVRIKGDCVKYVKNKNISPAPEFSFIFFDPPWGGTHYRFYTHVSLFLSNVNIAEIIREVFAKNLSKYVIVKVPRNYRIIDLHDRKYSLYRIANYMLVFCYL